MTRGYVISDNRRTPSSSDGQSRRLRYDDLLAYVDESRIYSKSDAVDVWGVVVKRLHAVGGQVYVNARIRNWRSILLSRGNDRWQCELLPAMISDQANHIEAMMKQEGYSMDAMR